MKKNVIKWILPLVVLLNACKKDDNVASTVIPPVVVDTTSKQVAYVLSEGGFGQNNSYLAYRVDSSGALTTDYFHEKNPSLAGLGDIANDMIVYGNKIYILVNGSGKITVLNLSTGILIDTIDVPAGPRFAVGYNGKVYATAYDGTVKVIDTTSLTITKSIVVGPNPEGLVAVGNYLYVANSGGFNPVPDSTVSVIDLSTELETMKITACLNPQKIEANSLGELYVSGYGNYFASPSIPPAIAVLSSATKARIDTLSTADYSYDHLRIHNDTAYFYGGGPVKMYNTLTHTTIRNEFITDGTLVATPYGVNIDDKGDVYIADAGDFSTTPGIITCFNKEGVKKFSFSVAPAINPNKIVFVNR